MAYLDPSDTGKAISTPKSFNDDETGILTRMWRWLNGALRPARGWIVFLLAMALTQLPVYALRINHWTRLGETQATLMIVGVASVLVTWLIAGWRVGVLPSRWRGWQMLSIVLALLLLGAAIISILMLRWLPPPQTLWQAALSGDPTGVMDHLNLSVERYAARVALWQVGTQGSNAIPDEVIFATFASMIIWLLGCATAALCRLRRSGMAAALPALLISATIILAAGSGKWLFLGGVALVLALIVAIDNGRLVDRWQREELDFSRDLFIDRWGNAGALAILILVGAGALASVSFASISDYVATLLNPVTEQVESASRQSFPNIAFGSRYDDGSGNSGSTGSGLPNDFLLGAGPATLQTKILQLRTSDAANILADMDVVPPAPYLFSRAFSDYTGVGWNAPSYLTRETIHANERLSVATIANRRLLAQSVVRYEVDPDAAFTSEIAEMGVNAVVDIDDQMQVVRMTTAQRNYTLLSALPALDEISLRAIPAWGDGDNLLPDGFDAFLELPTSVTERTRTLATEIVADVEGPYAQASAIEAYLRAFPYDLSISAPPEGVTDVADYFLFELQRGYCDYFATAFVVMARSVGLPTRFVTGYGPGSWSQSDRAWLVTAANSHAWPEVYLPTIGWLPFEPTSGLSPLQRVGGTQLNTAPVPLPLPPDETPPSTFEWNWQMGFWAIPVALVVWAIWSLFSAWRKGRQDPWHTLEQWGARRGRPADPAETPAEYAAALATLAESLQRRSPEAAHTVARSAVAIGDAEAMRRFARAPEQTVAAAVIKANFEKIRDLLPRVR